MKRLAIILLLFMLLPLVGKGQAIWQWATDANSANSEIARDLAVDATNDFVYVVGEWNGNLEGDFGAGAGPLNFTTTYGNKDGFIAKYDLNGSLIWAFKVGSSNDDCVTGVSVGPSGNIYVTGYFTGLGEFEGISPGVPGSITSAGGRDIFQAAYNPAGQLLWVFDNGGTGDDEGTAVATNSSGVYFTGSYTASAAIGGFGSNSNLGGDEIFVNKRSFTGISQWLIDGASDGDDVGNDLVANETNVFLIGNFSGATIGYFDAGSGASSTIANSSSGTNDITLLSIDQGSGNLVWHQTIGSSLDDFGNGITLDTDGFYCTGATNVNPNFPTLGTVGGQNAQDIFVSGHNLTNGSTNWAFSEVGNGADIAHGISSNQFGELFVSGEYDGTTDFSGDINTTTGADDIFISKYTNTGTFGWVQTAGNTNEDRALSITTYQANVAFICGEFRNNSDFDPLPALTGDATSDLFTARLDECDGTFSYSSATFCSNETNPAPTVNGSIPGTFTAPADVSFISATTGEINLTASTPGGPYTITYTPACGTPATFDVTILPTDDPSFTYTATSYCENDDNPIPTITGTTGGTFSGSAEITFVNPLTGEIDISSSTLGGPYTIIYTTPGPACPNTATFDLTLSAVQDPTFGYPSDTYCLDGSKITPTISGVAGGFFGASSFSIDIDGSTGEIDLDPVMSGPGTYWIYYMTPGPICPGVDSFEITLLTPDDPSFTYPSPICITGENPFPISVTTPGGTFSEIALLVPFADATTGEIDLSGCTPGDYVIQYATSGVCPDSSTQNITILPAIDSTFWVPDTICQGSPPINLSDSTSIESWETHYFYSYGPLGSADLSGPNMEIFDPEESEAGSYFITHVVDNGVCMDSMTISVTILPDYDATTSIPDTLCAIEGVYDLNTYLIDYTSSSGGIWFGSTIVDDSLWDVSDLGGAFYDIGYTIGFGHCTDTTNYSIYIADDADSNWTDPPLLCRSSEILNLADLITGTEGGTFSGIGVVNDSLFNPFISGTGTHSITYTVGGGSCAESLTKTITILEDPTAYAGVNSESCGLDAQLAATSNSPGIWTASSTAIFSGETDPNSSVDVVEYGTHIFYWSVDQSGVCSAVDSVEITFFEQPIADAGPDQQLNFIFETEMDATIPTGNSGQWKLESGGGNIWNDADMNTSIDQLELGPNQFSWTVENGPCPAHTDEVIIMINSVFIPEAITPNGDGKNDLFEIKGIESHPNTVKIFNRWGQTVYEITNYQNDWRGTDASGNPLPNDTYFYIITIGETLNYNGHLLIKK